MINFFCREYIWLYDQKIMPCVLTIFFGITNEEEPILLNKPVVKSLDCQNVIKPVHSTLFELVAEGPADVYRTNNIWGAFYIAALLEKIEKEKQK